MTSAPFIDIVSNVYSGVLAGGHVPPEKNFSGGAKAALCASYEAGNSVLTFFACHSFIILAKNE